MVEMAQERRRVAPRNIDFEALRSLRGRHGATFSRGDVVVREGDRSSEFYVVLQGAVDFTITDRATGAPVVVGSAGVSDFFGEIACFGGLTRTATATAAEDGTVLLFFDRETAVELLRTSPRFALGVIQRVGDRVFEADELLRGAGEEIAALKARLAIRRGTPVFDRALEAAATAAASAGQ
jgi:CRP/FNR family cyclic AMP-dependent transcriptional regulator